MIEPIALQDFFISFFVSALIILSGACYALLYAWSKTSGRLRLRWMAYLAYLVLLISVVILSLVAHFSGYWLWLSVAMVIGYFMAPIAIWQLCIKTHHQSNKENNNE